MQPLEQALRSLAAKLTGQDLAGVPTGEMERVLTFMAKNVTAGGGEAGPQGEKGEKGD